MRLPTTLILLCTLTACGTRGPLELPPGPPPTPVFGGGQHTGTGQADAAR
ncbi:MAG: lipoprotein [Rhodocyclaceae bacterium]|nr:lipoprotein [Rhodocyclaceae bacterium]